MCKGLDSANVRNQKGFSMSEHGVGKWVTTDEKGANGRDLEVSRFGGHREEN